MNYPPGFLDSLAALSVTDALPLAQALDSEPPVSVRFNPYKVAEKPKGEPVPWSRYGFYLSQRPVFTLDPAFHAGVYYVQEASSMFIEHIYRSIFGDREKLRILDLCAAPGGKTTLLSTLAGLEGAVVANETVRGRAFTLAANVAKWGLGNVVVTNNDPSHFEGFRDYFDLIVTDVPCSGEGMFRKNPDAREQWSPENVRLCSQRQKRILSDIWQSLKPGGILIYSTCTFNREENEDNIAWLADNHGAEGIDIDVTEEWGIVRENIETAGPPAAAFRFYPHLLRGEGFFTAIVGKPDGKCRTRLPKPRREGLEPVNGKIKQQLSPWVAQPEFMDFARAGDNYYGYYLGAMPVAKTMAESMAVVHSGVKMGQLFGNKLKPDHSLALFHDIARDNVKTAGLDTEQALDYLRKRDLPPDIFGEGTNLVTWNGLALGWAKRIGNRINNLYPKESRIINL